MINNFTCSIHKGFSFRKESVGAYRFIANPKVTEQKLIDRLSHSTSQSVEGKRVLVLADTTEYNLHSHIGRIKDFEGIGATSLNDIWGFFSQNQLVLERQSQQAIGWANIMLFNRPLNNKAFKRGNYTLPIAEKESNKWLEPSVKSRDEILHQASHCLYVMDREADIYEILSSLPNDRCDILIRAKHNRRVLNDRNEIVKLKEDINRQEAKAKVTVHIDGENRKRTKREAVCELKWKEYTIPQPKNIVDKSNYAESIKVTALHIEETKNIPSGESPVQWTLWTTEKISDTETALELLNCYSARWTIEEAHRLLKKKGFNIESSELESGRGIRKLLILAMEASVKVMQLKAARNGDTTVSLVEIFEEDEIVFLEVLNNQLQGKTIKSSNPHNKDLLSWGSWIIARLGGWKGYSSQRPPGTITFKRGLDNFYLQFRGFQLAKRL